jgi:hypothetical protein
MHHQRQRAGALNGHPDLRFACVNHPEFRHYCSSRFNLAKLRQPCASGKLGRRVKPPPLAQALRRGGDCAGLPPHASFGQNKNSDQGGMDMTAHHIKLTREEDGIAILTIDRPDKRGAMTYQMLHTFIDAVREAGKDDSVRVLIVTGSGGSFCAAGRRISLRESLPRQL